MHRFCLRKSKKKKQQHPHSFEKNLQNSRTKHLQCMYVLHVHTELFPEQKKYQRCKQILCKISLFWQPQRINKQTHREHLLSSVQKQKNPPSNGY